jgi:hypothetical protein
MGFIKNSAVDILSYRFIVAQRVTNILYSNSKVVMVRWIELFVENRSATYFFVREHRIADKLL